MISTPASPSSPPITNRHPPEHFEISLIRKCETVGMTVSQLIKSVNCYILGKFPPFQSEVSAFFAIDVAARKTELRVSIYLDFLSSVVWFALHEAHLSPANALFLCNLMHRIHAQIVGL